MFNAFNESLSASQRERLRETIKRKNEELLAARSEDARVRLVHQYIEEVHELLEVNP